MGGAADGPTTKRPGKEAPVAALPPAAADTGHSPITVSAVEDPEEDMPTVARGMSRSDLAKMAAQGAVPPGMDFDEFDEAGDTVVSQLPDMSSVPGIPAGRPAAHPGGVLNQTVTAADSPIARGVPSVGPSLRAPMQRPSLPQPNPGSVSNPALGPAPSSGFRPASSSPSSVPREPTLTAHAPKRGIPTWAVIVGATLLGVLAFVLVLFTLSRLSSPARSTASAGALEASPFAPARAGLVAAAKAVAPVASAAQAPLATPSDQASAPPGASPSAANSLDPAKGATAASGPNKTPARPSAPSVAASSGALGTLKIVCNPRCTQVVDNDQDLGPSPITKYDAAVGSHRIRLSWGDASKVVSTIVVGGQTAIVGENHP
jgi:hypothetical protein